MTNYLLSPIGLSYQYLLKPVLFRFDPELVHEQMVTLGENLTSITIAQNLLYTAFSNRSPILSQTIAGIKFPSPIGLAAGFDYRAKLTQVLPALGFGFGTVGTISNLPCEGNPKPRLGRLPKSKALLVNKGFRNPGADAVINKLQSKKFSIPVGISIGKTNSPDIKTQDQAVKDILSAFEKFENASIKNSYYELNISCPNLSGTVDFYQPEHLSKLLQVVAKLKITKPIFIKMPISKSDEEILQILEVIVFFNTPAVIIGNLQTDRSNPALIPNEVDRCNRGNFSGKPTEKRSNELIGLVYKYYKNRLKIIGCGGVFSADDAYAKISLGASLIQLITGMIYQGPQLIAQINQDLAVRIKAEGYATLPEAIGSENISSIS